MCQVRDGISPKGLSEWLILQKSHHTKHGSYSALYPDVNARMSAYIDFIEEAICQLSDHAPSYCGGGHVTDKRPRGLADASFEKGHASPASSAFNFSAFDTAKSTSGAGSTTVNRSDHHQVGFGSIGTSKGVTTKTNTTTTNHSAWEFNNTKCVVGRAVFVPVHGHPAPGTTGPTRRIVLHYSLLFWSSSMDSNGHGTFRTTNPRPTTDTRVLIMYHSAPRRLGLDCFPSHHCPLAMVPIETHQPRCCFWWPVRREGFVGRLARGSSACTYERVARSPPEKNGPLATALPPADIAVSKTHRRSVVVVVVLKV
jgi:hypothetical protein